jgi:aminodeoxyfutalosine synthase
MSLIDQQFIISQASVSKELKEIAALVLNSKRISPEQGLYLYANAPLGILALLANHVREKKNGDQAYFNRNIHIEPTNICIYHCRFCSYSRDVNQEGSWEYTPEEIYQIVRNHASSGITEVHIVGGVHPDRDIHYYGNIITTIKKLLPGVHVKGFTAIELDFLFRKSHLTYEEGFLLLKQYGLDSIPGGGAEIFDEGIRKKVCDEKSSSSIWLNIHETAHKLGIPSNATMLYGHIENYTHRIDHLNRLRNLQDITGGFNAFIPLKYRMKNNSMSHLGEVSITEDLRNYAVSRIFLDNIPHIKAYWPMIGREIAGLTLQFGADDMDGTIDDTTRIYAMSGAEEQSPSMTTNDMIALIKEAGLKAVERGSLYNVLKVYE